MAFLSAAFTLFFLQLAYTKVYERCELAKELRDVQDIPDHHLATWLCIINYESHYNTAAHNAGSGDHGLFQISELYWCSPPGLSCGVTCDDMRDDDIEDDVICAKRVYRQHQRISGNGFTAWVVYDLYCRNPTHVASFVHGCFDEENLVKQHFSYVQRLQSLTSPEPSSTRSTTIESKKQTTGQLPSTTHKMSSIQSSRVKSTTQQGPHTSEVPSSITHKVVSTTESAKTLVHSTKPQTTALKQKSTPPLAKYNTKPTVSSTSHRKTPSASRTITPHVTFSTKPIFSATLKPLKIDLPRKHHTATPVTSSVESASPRSPSSTTKSATSTYKSFLSKSTSRASKSTMAAVNKSTTTPRTTSKGVSGDVIVKQREIKPSDFDDDEEVYNGYSFSRSSNGFKLFKG